MRTSPAGVRNVEGVDGRLAEPLGQAVGRAGDVERDELDLGLGHLRRVLGRVDVPRRDVRQLRIGPHAAGADLAPLQVEAVGTSTVAGHRVTADATLDLGHVVDRHAPGHPPAAGVGALADGLAEGGLVGRRVVEHLHDLEVLLVLERQDHVAGAEARVRPTVEEGGTEEAAELGGGTRETVGAGSERDVVEVHTAF
jgi:hypothetical protein